MSRIDIDKHQHNHSNQSRINSRINSRISKTWLYTQKNWFCSRKFIETKINSISQMTILILKSWSFIINTIVQIFLKSFTIKMHRLYFVIRFWLIFISIDTFSNHLMIFVSTLRTSLKILNDKDLILRNNKLLLFLIS